MQCLECKTELTTSDSTQQNPVYPICNECRDSGWLDLSYINSARLDDPGVVAKMTEVPKRRLSRKKK